MRVHNRITIISIAIGAIINAVTFHSRGWDAFGHGLMFGLFPLLALLAVLIVSCFFSTLTKTQKLIIAIGVAYTLLANAIILGTKPTWIRALLPCALWLLPLLVWNFLIQWFRRRRPQSDHQA